MMNDRETREAAHQKLTIRAASIASASTSARHTNDVERSSRLAAGRAAARIRGALRIRNAHARGLRKSKAPARRGLLQAGLATLAYLSEPLIKVNLACRLVPSPLTIAMIASAMPAAIRPYSIAVAPDSSFTKRASRFFITQLHVHVAVELKFGRAGVLSTVTMGVTLRVRQLRHG